MTTTSVLSSTLRRRPWSTAVVHVLLVLIAMLFASPALWMLLTSLKPIEQTMAFPIVYLPAPARFENYLDAINYIPFFEYTKNTFIASFLAAFGTTLSSALVAYSFARLSWPGRNLLFALTLATMMLPFPVLMVPLYNVFKTLGWIGTLYPLWVPSFFGSAFNIFLLRQFFLRVPKDLSEAMTIDGAGELTIFWRIYVPLAKAPLAVVAFFQFIYVWNDFLAPLLFLTDQSTFTLSLGLQFYQSRLGGTQWHYLMAASILTTLPVVVLFFFMQKSFLRGLGSLRNVDA
jgi:multiple sugar transport system permease protein